MLMIRDMTTLCGRRGFLRLSAVCEAILIVLACLSPWALGSVNEWAELGLMLGIAVVTILSAIIGWSSDRSRDLLCLPSLALAGLVFYALAQTVPLPEGVLGWLA